MTVIEIINQRFTIRSRDVMAQTMEVASQMRQVDLMGAWAENVEPLMEYYQKILQKKVPEGYVSAIDVWNKEIQDRERQAK